MLEAVMITANGWMPVKRYRDYETPTQRIEFVPLAVNNAEMLAINKVPDDYMVPA
jgi:hypothetical protein